jgi:hypothetical protein
MYTQAKAIAKDTMMALQTEAKRAAADRQQGNLFNAVCDPTGACTSDGQHTITLHWMG